MTRRVLAALAALGVLAPTALGAPAKPSTPTTAPAQPAGDQTGGTAAPGALPKSPFAGMSADTSQPIHVTADQQQADFKAETVTYTGNVHAVQGRMTLRADTVVANTPKGHLSKVTATGDVVITSEDATARAPVAVYDVVAHTIVLSGDVVLTQGPNTLRGTLLTVDLSTSTAKLTAGDGRVDGILMPNSLKPAGNKSPDAKAPGKAKKSAART